MQGCNTSTPIATQLEPRRAVTIDSILYLQAATPTHSPSSISSKDTHNSKLSPLTQQSIQEMIDSALAKEQKKLDAQIELMEQQMGTLQLQLEEFKKESIHLIVNSLIEKEPFVTQVKFAKFENNIKLTL